MAFAAGSEHGVRYVSEATFGTTPGTPQLTSLRHTQCSLVLSKDSFQSAELRNDRQIADFRHGTKQVKGNINFELSYAEFDPFIKAALGNTFQSALARSGAIAARGNPTYQIYSSAVTFTPFVVGDVIVATGFTTNTNNNTTFVVSAVATTSMTLRTVPHTLATNIANTVTITRAISCWAGTKDLYFTVERAFSDIAKYARFTGCMVDTMSLSIKPNAIITGVMGIIGKGGSYTATPLDASVTASQTYSPYDSFTGSIYENDTSVALITSMDLNINNNGRATFVVGSNTTPAIVLGRSNVSGSMSVYFQDLTMLNKFINETESSVELYIGTGLSGGYSYRLFLPRIKYGSGDNTVNDEGPIEMKMDFQALYSSTYGYNIAITKIP